MPLTNGTRLGPYEILGALGAGGMGEVYRARDTKLDRDVAIKVLPESVAADPESLARFEREAKAVAALSHPNILSIFDFGSQDGVSYAVMELLEGETLRAKLDAGPISQKQAVDYALQIAMGLSAAHEKGVVHRDLKPENLFVGKDGHLKILDFGLAKRVEAVAPGEETRAPTISGRTAAGTVLGTVGYMSPEQVRGLPVDHRSDIFSFGTILYELFSGKRAFTKDTAQDTMAAILRDDPPVLSASVPHVSPALDRIVKHCLEKDQDRRFHSVHDIAFALSESLTPATARSTRGTILAAAAVVVLLAGAGVLLVRWPRGGAGEAAGVMRVAVLPFENLGTADDDYFADGIADEIRGKLTSLPGFQVIARSSSIPYKKTTKTPKQIAEELNVSYLLTATVRWEKSGGANRVHVSPELVDVTRTDAPTSKWQQSFDAPLMDVFQVQSDIAARVARALGLALGAQEEKQLSQKPTQNLAAYDAFLKGDDTMSGTTLGDPASVRKALGFYEQAVALDPGFALAWARLSRASSRLFFSSTPTSALAERARQAADKAVALAPNRPEGYVALASYDSLVTLDFNRAMEHLAKAEPMAPGNADLLATTGDVEMRLGRWDAAVAHLQQADRLDPRSIGSLTRLGFALSRLRRYPEARETFDRGLALAPANLSLIQRKVLTFLPQGDLAGARGVLNAVPRDVEPTALVAFVATANDLVWVLDEQQQELLLRLTPVAFDDDRGTWALCLTQAYALKGDAANVRKYAEEARNAFEEQLHATPEDPQLHVVHGLALAYLGRKDEAIREGERGVALSPVAKDAYRGPYLQHQLVRIYMLVNEPEKALDRLEPLLKIPYQLSPGWLAIDPNFDALRKEPRFRRLVAAGSAPS